MWCKKILERKYHRYNGSLAMNLSRNCFPTDSIVSQIFYSRQTFPLTTCRSVCLWVCLSVCPVHCGKTADRIRMPFGMMGWTGLWMRQIGLVGFGDRATGMGDGKYGALGEFLELQARRAGELCRLRPSARCG